MRLLLSFIICSTFILKSFAQKEIPLKTIDSITIDMNISEGLITTYRNKKNDLFFEISHDLLEKELLVVTRFAQLPSDYSGYLNAGSKTAEHVVQFEKNNNKILLKEVSFTNIADKNDPISISVSENNFKPILASVEIKNSDKNRYLIDVTNYFMSDSPGFNVIRSYEKKFYRLCS